MGRHGYPQERGVDERAHRRLASRWARIIDESSYRLEDLEERRSAVAELFRLERNRQRAEIEQGSGRLGELLQAPEDRELRSAFMVWIKGALFGRIDESEIPDQLGLEEFRNMLEKTVLVLDGITDATNNFGFRDRKSAGKVPPLS